MLKDPKNECKHKNYLDFKSKLTNKYTIICFQCGKASNGFKSIKKAQKALKKND